MARINQPPRTDHGWIPAAHAMNNGTHLSARRSDARMTRCGETAAHRTRPLPWEPGCVGCTNNLKAQTRGYRDIKAGRRSEFCPRDNRPVSYRPVSYRAVSYRAVSCRSSLCTDGNNDSGCPREIQALCFKKQYAARKNGAQRTQDPVFPPCFSSRRVYSITMPRSTALHMSYSVSAATEAAVNASISTPVCPRKRQSARI